MLILLLSVLKCEVSIVSNVSGLPEGNQAKGNFFTICYANSNLMCIAFQLKDDQAKGNLFTISYANYNLICIAFQLKDDQAKGIFLNYFLR